MGQRGEGWKVSRSTLVHERKLIGDPHFLRSLFKALVELARRTERGGRPRDRGLRACASASREIEGYMRAPGVHEPAPAHRDRARRGRWRR